MGGLLLLNPLAQADVTVARFTLLSCNLNRTFSFSSNWCQNLD